MLVLVTDAYGGTGGIAQYCRDLIEAVAGYESVSSVTVVPRVISRDIQKLPPRVTQLATENQSKLRYAQKVLSISRRGSFDLVVCGHINLLPLAWLAAKRIKSPVILATYGAEVWDRANFLVRQIASRTNGILSISRFTRDRMMKWLPVDKSTFFIVPNAIDVQDFAATEFSEREVAARYGLQGTPILLTFGRMDASEKAKGFDEVLEAMPALLREFPRLVYCLAGDGSDRARLMAKAENLGVQSRVAFPGYVPESDKAALFRAADVYVMPGRLEGFGYVFLEALAAGTPVIGSTLDASREAMMDGKWGIVVDPADQGALIDAIRSSIFSPQVPERMELEYFSKRQFLTRMHAMLNRVLDA